MLHEDSLLKETIKELEIDKLKNEFKIRINNPSKEKLVNSKLRMDSSILRKYFICSQRTVSNSNIAKEPW